MTARPSNPEASLPTLRPRLDHKRESPALRVSAKNQVLKVLDLSPRAKAKDTVPTTRNLATGGTIRHAMTHAPMAACTFAPPAEATTRLHNAIRMQKGPRREARASASDPMSSLTRFRGCTPPRKTTVFSPLQLHWPSLPPLGACLLPLSPSQFQVLFLRTRYLECYTCFPGPLPAKMEFPPS
jgi:hypothetical protein